MSAGDTKRKIGGKRWSQLLVGEGPVSGVRAVAGFYPLLARKAAAQLYSASKATYQVISGRKAFNLYGSDEGGLQNFDALRDKINNDPSDARVQLSRDQLSAIVSFKNDNRRYECPHQRMATQFHKQLSNRQLLSKYRFGRNPIYQLSSDETQRNINTEQHEQTTREQSQNIEATEVVSKRIQQMPENLRSQLEKETRILPAPLRSAYVDNMQHVINAGGENFMQGLSEPLQERIKIIKNLSQLSPEDTVERLRAIQAATPEQKRQMLDELRDGPSHDSSGAGLSMPQVDPAIRDDIRPLVRAAQSPPRTPTGLQSTGLRSGNSSTNEYTAPTQHAAQPRSSR